METQTETEMVRRKTDRILELDPLPLNVHLSPFFSKAMAFTVKRKLKRLDRATSVICSTTHDSDQKLVALKQIGNLIIADSRPGDYLDSKVLPHLLKFMEVKEIKTPPDSSGSIWRITHPEDKKNRKFQFYTAIILTRMVFSEKGYEFTEPAIPSLVKLIPSPFLFVQIQALYALSHIANVFPACCNAIINCGALELLESLLSNVFNDSVLLRNAGMLLAALCRMKPHLPSIKREIVLRTLRVSIFLEDDNVIVQACLALFNFSKDGFVAIENKVLKRLLRLLEYTNPRIILLALRAIGNYVRWGTHNQIQFMFDRVVLMRLAILLYHKFTEVKTESCWITSNITAAANNLELQKVVDMGLISVPVALAKRNKVKTEFKVAAAYAMFNAVLGSDKKQFKYLKENCECLNSADPRTSPAYRRLRESIYYREEVLDFLPENLGVGSADNLGARCCPVLKNHWYRLGTAADLVCPPRTI
ncbi:hypothetical protein POM88_037365 [Heracleum sosnowskyi]|uniref:Uncharacterized protein n=1 Tax=Heracleum sosnowskyi TaxID=360622 RepID=A0AAD8HQZ1_9APIA|nr:hypothetical protein POM88_037365 [Heracleum sosnowskyi]